MDSYWDNIIESVEGPRVVHTGGTGGGGIMASEGTRFGFTKVDGDGGGRSSVWGCGCYNSLMGPYSPSIAPGSGNHWSDGFRSVSSNYGLMFRSEFERAYGIDLDTDEGKWFAAQALAGKPTPEYFKSTIAPALGVGVMEVGADGAWVTTNLVKAVYAGGLEAENQIAMGIYGATNISLGIGRGDLFGALYGLPGSKSNPWLTVASAHANILGGVASISAHGPKPRYTGPGDWAKQVKLGTKFANRLGAAGLLLTGIDMINNGVNAGNTLDAFFGLVSFAGPVGAAIGGVYFVSNALTIGITGKSIGEHIDDNFIFIKTGMPLSPIIPIPR